jgi:phage portal protein BeeE
MGLGSALKQVWERVNGVDVGASGEARKTAVGTGAFAPYLTPFAPAVRAVAVPKATVANLRRFAETPVARRAINFIKDRIASMEWRLEVKPGVAVSGAVAERMSALRAAFDVPNASDSFRTLMEQVLEDILVSGCGAVEVDADTAQDSASPDAAGLRLYPVDSATIEVDWEWNGDAAVPRYAQRKGPGSAGALTLLRDDELMYVRLNPRTHTPFGLGKLEVAFESVSQFLEAHRYAARLANNSVVQYALWMSERTPEQHERLIRWWQDDVEGSGRVPVLSSAEKPEVLRFAGGTDADLRLEWQEFLLRMVANAFDLPPMVLGLEKDVNRSTAAEMQDDAFATAIIPLAKLMAEHLTRDVIAKRLGWTDVRFVWSELESRDEMVEVEIQTKLLAAGVLSVDEVRAMRGLSVTG